KEGPPDFRTDRGDANPPSHYGELTINLLIASSRLVNHYAAATVAHVPLGHQVLVPGGKFFRVRSAGCGRLAPDLRQSGAEGGIDNTSNRLAYVLLGNEASPDIEQVFVTRILLACAYPLQPSVCTKPVQAQKEPLSQDVAIQVLVRRGTPEDL